MYDQTGTVTVGSIQLTVIGTFVTGTGTTPLGTPTVLRGYNTGLKSHRVSTSPDPTRAGSGA